MLAARGLWSAGKCLPQGGGVQEVGWGQAAERGSGAPQCSVLLTRMQMMHAEPSVYTASK